MLTRRIIPCLDVRDGRVVKGVRFREHEIVGDILEMAQRYREAGADELVFYDITASAEDRVVDPTWVRRVAREIDIPFTVAGGIRSVADARRVLGEGADKISINSPALERPALIGELAEAFGVQCVVIGVDSRREPPAEPGAAPEFGVYQYTGDIARTVAARRDTRDWVGGLAAMGAGEIVLNTMDADGTKAGYDIAQLEDLRRLTDLPLIASGGAGTVADFDRVFREADVDGALAASIFHRGEVAIADLKRYLSARGHEIRPYEH